MESAEAAPSPKTDEGNLEEVRKLAAAGEPLIDLNKSNAERAAEQEATQTDTLGADAAKDMKLGDKNNFDAEKQASDKAAKLADEEAASAKQRAKAEADASAKRAAEREADAEAHRVEQRRRAAEVWRKRKLHAPGEPVYYRSGGPHQDGHEGTTLHAGIITMLHDDWSADLTVFPRRAGMYHVERAPLARVDDPEDCGIGTYRPRD